jgi:hypothetical protein
LAADTRHRCIAGTGVGHSRLATSSDS